VGIDFHGLRFLQIAAANRPLCAVLTLGRQEVHLSCSDQASLLGLRGEFKFGDSPHCESLLSHFFGASKVDSMDISDFEGATILADLSKPISSFDGNFDSILDFGTLEHVFNFPQAIENICRMTARGGIIIHVLPSNNFNGHGFYQFSPELFFSMYSKPNGFADTQVFLADLSDQEGWFEVKIPSNGNRHAYESSSPVYVLVKTIKVSDLAKVDSVQQSDYLHEWSQQNGYRISPTSITKSKKVISVKYY
jgi:hypothetical protein